MAWQSHHKNNFAAGAFLLIAMFAAVAMSIVLAGDPFKSTSLYTVAFDLGEGVPGIKAGSKVNVGGFQVGEVASVKADMPGDGAPIGIIVTIEISSKIRLYTDALITLERPLLGSLSEINIPDIGGRAGNAAFADRDTIFDGMIAPPSLLRDAGWGDAERSKLRSILERLDSATSKADEVIANIDAPGINDAIDDLQGGIADVREIIAGVKEDLPGWRGSADRILTNTEDFSSKMPEMADNINTHIDTTGEMINTVDDVINENRQSFGRIVDNTESITRSVRDEWVALGTETLTSARDGAATFNEIAGETQLMIAENRESIARSLANLRLASDQLKLAMLEIRAQPWRLLVRPDTKEFETQVLYDAARSYAMAASDLRAASASLDAAAARGEIGLGDPETIERILAELEESFEKYKDAESELLDEMIKKRP